GIRPGLPGPPDRRPRRPGCGASHRLRARGGVRGHRAGHVADRTRRDGRWRRRPAAQGRPPFLSCPGVQHGGGTPDSGGTGMSQSTIKVALAGAGAFGIKHLDGIRNIEGVEVVSLISRDIDKTRKVAEKYGIAHATTELDAALSRPEVDAVILCTPTQMHASQAMACLRAGKHVQVEIPMADSLEDAEALVALAAGSGKVAMCGHTRRFNPSHQYVHGRVTRGEFNIQQMDVQTYFFRRTNMNALGEPRSWTDHLLWHHAAHTVDLFAYQAGSPVVQANALQ